MEPLNKEERQKAIFKAAAWTILALLVMFFGIKGYFDAKAAINNLHTDAAKKYEAVVKVKNNFQGRLAKADSLYRQFDQASKKYLVELKNNIPEPSTEEVIRFKKAFNTELDLIELENKASEVQEIYAALLQSQRRLINSKEAIRKYYENPPPPDCQMCPFDASRCPDAPDCPPAPECPTICQDKVSNFKIKLGEAIDRAFGQQISKDRVNEIVRNFLP